MPIEVSPRTVTICTKLVAWLQEKQQREGTSRLWAIEGMTHMANLPSHSEVTLWFMISGCSWAH